MTTLLQIGIGTQARRAIQLQQVSNLKTLKTFQNLTGWSFVSSFLRHNFLYHCKTSNAMVDQIVDEAR